MIEDLFAAIGLKSVIRNFLVEYHDKDMRSWHKPVQTLIIGLPSDKEVIKNIIEDQKEQGNEVYAIVEFYGSYSMDELKAIIEDSEISKYSYRLVFIDREKVCI
jgi:hypothetical protein